mmetsp:Transcript_89838/g.281241  ORF Transcript_89838/g.281241 Transcript_89838/m.281241 type:complete len:180 (-) Transcript_89838:81-620(-)
MAEKPYVLVTIVSARGLRPCKSGWVLGKASPPNAYCTCEVVGKPNSKFQTMAVPDSLDPEWKRKDYVEDYAIGDSLHFEVRNQGKKGEGELLGQAVIGSHMFQPNGYEGELQLSGAEGAFLTIKVMPAADPDAKEAPPAESQSLFDKVDTDGDGKITREEYSAAVAARVLPPTLPQPPE